MGGKNKSLFGYRLFCIRRLMKCEHAMLNGCSNYPLNVLSFATTTTKSTVPTNYSFTRIYIHEYRWYLSRQYILYSSEVELIVIMMFPMQIESNSNILSAGTRIFSCSICFYLFHEFRVAHNHT